MRNEPLTGNAPTPVSEIQEQLTFLEGSICRLADEVVGLLDQIRPVTKQLPPTEGGQDCTDKPTPEGPQSDIGLTLSLLRAKTNRIFSEVTTIKANLAI